MCDVFLDNIEELFREEKRRNNFIVINKPNHTDKALRRIARDLKRQQKKKS